MKSKILWLSLISLSFSFGEFPIATSPYDEANSKIAYLENDLVVVYRISLDGGIQVKAVRIDGLTGRKVWEKLVKEDGRQYRQQVAVAQDKKIWVVFEKYRPAPSGIFLQRFSPDGEREFGSMGLEVSAGEGDRTDPRLALSEEGCWIVWKDYRYYDSLGIVDVFCNYVNSKGEILSKDGIKVTRNTSGGGSPQVVSSLNGDAIILWGGRRPGDEFGAIFGQRLSPTAEFKWDTLGILIEYAWYFWGAIKDAEGRIILFFTPPGEESETRRGLEVRAQMIDNEGNILLPPGGVPIAKAENNVDIERFHFDADSISGFFVSYPYYAVRDTQQLIVKHFNSDFYLLWKEKLYEHFPYYDDWWHCHNYIVNTAPGECIVAWDTRSDSSFGDIWAARIADGSVCWKIPICTTKANQINCVACKDGKGGAYLVWENYDPSKGDCDIYGQHLDSAGVGIEEKIVSSQWSMVKLEQNYPNPFSQQTAISYQLTAPSYVKLKVYNASGQLVKTLIEGEKNPGSHRVFWNGEDKEDKISPSGIYFYELTAKSDRGTQREIRKVILLRRWQ